MVRGTWKRGHKARFEAHGTCAAAGLLPGPDVPDDDLDDWADLGVVGPPPPSRAGSPGTATGGTAGGGAGSGNTNSPDGAGEDDPFDDDELVPDPPPGHVTRQGQRQGRPAAGHGKVRVTAALRKDIEAKIRFVLVPTGQVWQARDPACGGTFAYQEPEISASLAEIVCDSPDLIGWFTGPAGGFMKYFRLFMALQPVGLTIYGHHVAHTIELEPVERQQADPRSYAA